MIRMLFGSTKNFLKETNHCEKSTSMRSWDRDPRSLLWSNAWPRPTASTNAPSSATAMSRCISRPSCVTCRCREKHWESVEIVQAVFRFFGRIRVTQMNPSFWILGGILKMGWRRLVLKDLELLFLSCFLFSDGKSQRHMRQERWIQPWVQVARN